MHPWNAFGGAENKVLPRTDPLIAFARNRSEWKHTFTLVDGVRWGV
jgi:hypothetical protein